MCVSSANRSAEPKARCVLRRSLWILGWGNSTLPLHNSLFHRSLHPPLAGPKRKSRWLDGCKEFDTFNIWEVPSFYWIVNQVELLLAHIMPSVNVISCRSVFQREEAQLRHPFMNISMITTQTLIYIGFEGLNCIKILIFTWPHAKSYLENEYFWKCITQFCHYIRNDAVKSLCIHTTFQYDNPEPS